MSSVSKYADSVLLVSALILWILCGASVQVNASTITEYNLPESYFSGPHSIYVYSGSIYYVADTIGRLDPNTGTIKEWGIPDLSPYPHIPELTPNEVFVYNGLVYLTQLSEIVTLDPASSVITEWTVPTAYPPDSPKAYCPAPYSIYVYDELVYFAIWGSKIGRLDPSTGIFTEWSIPTSSSAPSSIYLSNGLVYFTEYSGNKIGRLDPSTGVFTEWTVPTASSAPSSICVFGSSVYFTESVGNKIGRLDPSRGVFTEWTIPTSSSGSNDVTVSSGLVYFTEYSGNKIGRLDPYTGMFTEWSVPTASSAPSSIYVFGSSVYFTESAGNKIGLLTVNPVATITVTSVSNTMSTVTTTGGVSAVSNELLSPSTVASLVNFCWWDSIATTTSSATVLQDTVTVVPLQSGLSYVFVGAPQKQSVGPAGTVAANWIDGTAAAIMMGMIEHPTFSFDTNATAIDQDTNVATGGGSLLSAIPGGSTIFLSGGPFVNALVRNFEFNHATENTPVYFGSVVERGITYYVLFNSSTGKEISNTGAEVSPLMTIGPNNQTSPRTDFFVIEAFTDSHSNQVVMAYGYSGYGTFASALYFKTMFFPRQGNTLGNGYEIARWQDTNGNGLPDSADSYTILHSSYVGPS